MAGLNTYLKTVKKKKKKEPNVHKIKIMNHFKIILKISKRKFSLQSETSQLERGKQKLQVLPEFIEKKK